MPQAFYDVGMKAFGLEPGEGEGLSLPLLVVVRVERLEKTSARGAIAGLPLHDTKVLKE